MRIGVCRAGRSGTESRIDGGTFEGLGQGNIYNADSGLGIVDSLLLLKALGDVQFDMVAMAVALVDVQLLSGIEAAEDTPVRVSLVKAHGVVAVSQRSKSGRSRSVEYGARRM